MSAQPDSQVNIEWLVVSGDAIDAEWQNVDSCVALRQPPIVAFGGQPIDPPLPAFDEVEWWPGRCIV